MRFLTRKVIAFLVLAAFMAGIVQHDFNWKWLTHEYDHSLAALADTVDHNDVSKVVIKEIHSADSFNAAEHKLLHVLSHGDQAPSAWRIAFAKQVNVPSFPPVSLAEPYAVTDSLFRPPRIIHLA